MRAPGNKLSLVCLASLCLEDSDKMTEMTRGACCRSADTGRDPERTQRHGGSSEISPFVVAGSSPCVDADGVGLQEQPS